MPTSTANNQFPQFPEDIIRGLAREFVDLYAPIREVLPQALWLSFCTYLGAIVSPYVRLESGSSEPRIYGAIVGRSARTRKSTAASAAKEVFQTAFPETSAEGAALHIVPGFGSSEGLLSELESYPNVPTVVYLDEINILASKTSGEGTVGISAFNKLFNDHDYSHPLASGKGPRFKNAYLSLLGASTIEDFTETWKGKHAAAGFFSRLLLVGADESQIRIPIPKDPDPTTLRALVNGLQHTYQNVRKASLRYQLSTGAEETWGRFYASIGESDEWNRIDTYGMRLMALQTLLEGEDRVTEAIVQRVIDFLHYQVAVRKILSPVIAENALAGLQQRIINAFSGEKTLTKRQLDRKINAARHGTKLVKEAVAGLVGDGRLKVRQDDTHKATYELLEDNVDDPGMADPASAVSSGLDDSRDFEHVQ